MNIVVQKNIGAVVAFARAGAASTATAGGTGDATAVVGGWIDREAIGANYAGGSLPLSAAFGLAYTATLAAGKSLSAALLVEDSADGSTPNTYLSVPAAVIASSAAGGTVTGVGNFSVQLGSARRYVRFTWTPDLNATSVDTASLFPMLVFGGFDRLPTA
jgi:hypothetical protein